MWKLTLAGRDRKNTTVLTHRQLEAPLDAKTQIQLIRLISEQDELCLLQQQVMIAAAKKQR